MRIKIDDVCPCLQIVEHGQRTLEKIQAALSDIAQAQLDMEYSIPDTLPSPKK